MILLLRRVLTFAAIVLLVLSCLVLMAVAALFMAVLVLLGVAVFAGPLPTRVWFFACLTATSVLTVGVAAPLVRSVSRSVRRVLAGQAGPCAER